MPLTCILPKTDAFGMSTPTGDEHHREFLLVNYIAHLWFTAVSDAQDGDTRIPAQSLVPSSAPFLPLTHEE